MKVLLLMTVAAAAVALTKAAQCPVASVILPCVCTIGASGEPDMDCSDVDSNADLERVFQQSFPDTVFNNLVINPVTGHPAFTDITSFVFGDVSFQHVVISNTYIRTVAEEAFAASHNTLISLDLSNNKIDSFPIEALPVFLHLRILNLANNRLPLLPNMDSPSLLSLDISQNVGLTITENTFIGLIELEALFLSRMGLVSLPPNVFSTLTFIKILDLSHNYLTGVLEQDIIRVPLDSLEQLMLNDNDLTQIHSSAITGMDRIGTVDFRNNLLTTLDMDNWSPLLGQLTGAQVVDLEGNALTCGCDALWLLLDLNNLDKIKDSARCSDGTFFKDTDTDPLLISC